MDEANLGPHSPIYVSVASGPDREGRSTSRQSLIGGLDGGRGEAKNGTAPLPPLAPDHGDASLPLHSSTIVPPIHPLGCIPENRHSHTKEKSAPDTGGSDAQIQTAILSPIPASPPHGNGSSISAAVVCRWLHQWLIAAPPAKENGEKQTGLLPATLPHPDKPKASIGLLLPESIP